MWGADVSMMVVEKARPSDPPQKTRPHRDPSGILTDVPVCFFFLWGHPSRRAGPCANRPFQLCRLFAKTFEYGKSQLIRATRTSENWKKKKSRYGSIEMPPHHPTRPGSGLALRALLLKPPRPTPSCQSQAFRHPSGARPSHDIQLCSAKENRSSCPHVLSSGDSSQAVAPSRQRDQGSPDVRCRRRWGT